MPIKPLCCMFDIGRESFRWTVKSFIVQIMLFAQRCLSIWRQILGAGVARGFDPALRQFSSEGAATLGSQESLEQITSRIFGTHIGNGLRSGRKVLRKRLIGDKIASYYPEPVAKYDPMFVDMNIERCSSYSRRLSTLYIISSHAPCSWYSAHTLSYRKKLKLDKLRRRGKAPPKKGQGKRASKKR